MDKESEMIFQTVKEQCQDCGNLTIFEIPGRYTEREPLTDNGIFHVTEWRLMKCMTCNQPMLEQTIQVIKERRGGFEETYEEWEEILEGPETITIYPVTNLAQIPTSSSDMPPDVGEDYEEARAIFGSSPRSSAALLRLALQKLCKHLSLPGKDLNSDIKKLVEKERLASIQQALDIVRVIGNNAVHPGEIDLRDNKEIALALFGLLNFIVEVTISRPKEISKIYDSLPQNAKQAIQNRDQKAVKE